MHSETMKERTASLYDTMDEMLKRCTPGQQDVFRRMYNHEGKYSRDVDGVKLDRIDWALSQIEGTLAKNQRKGEIK